MRVASATQMNEEHSQLNLSRRFLGTFKIGQILPVFHEFCVPGDKFKVNLNMFSRFLPLAVPSYVKLKYRTLSVFVPYHQVVDGYESFMSNQKLFKGVTIGLPRLSTITILDYFIGTPEVATYESEDSSKTYDFIYKPLGGPSTPYGVTLTAVGRYQYKLLCSLGIRIAHRTIDTAGAPGGVMMNATPLLAFAHAYNSYMSYSPNYNTSALSLVLETIKRSPDYDVNAADLGTILSSVLLTYEESFVSSLWASPYYGNNNTTLPYTGAFNDVQEKVVGASLNSVEYNSATGSRVGLTSSTPTLSASQIRLLLKFDDYFRRSNFAGSKDIEQIYSRFGVKIDDYKTRYPYFLNESSQDVAIGDVTSTADTSSAPIGAYAGKAIGSADAGFTFESKDYGMLITLAWFAPYPVYYMGIDKEYLRKEPFQFYTPELDQGFPDAVTFGEIKDNEDSNYKVTFGYAPLYSQYLYAKDQIVGDFDRFVDYQPWHFGRNFADLSGSYVAQSDGIIYIPQQGSSNFERIFNVQDTDLVDQDSIMTKIDVSVSANRPMKDRVGKSGLGDGNLDIPALGSQIN